MHSCACECVCVCVCMSECVETAGDFLLNILLNDPLFYMKPFLASTHLLLLSKEASNSFYTTAVSKITILKMKDEFCCNYFDNFPSNKHLTKALAVRYLNRFGSIFRGSYHINGQFIHKNKNFKINQIPGHMG